MADVHNHPTDSRQRPYIQVRFYGQMALDIDRRADAEGKSRSTLVAELVSAAWGQPSPEPQRIVPSSLRHDNAHEHEAPPQTVTTHRARVFAPSRRR